MSFSFLQVFINATVVALMAIYVYENERKMEKMSIKHDLTENQQIAGSRKLNEVENQQISGKRNLTEVEIQLIAVTRKLAELENQLLMSNEKGVTYIRWGKTKCDGFNTETIYSGQVGGGHYSHTGASVNYICLPENPDVALPLKKGGGYAILYGAEYEIFERNKPEGIRSGLSDLEVACAACLTKGKEISIMIPGRKTCYNGWTKEYEGILMAGATAHVAASEYACVDKATEVIAGGSSKNDNGKLFYPVITSCGSLKCPPYKQDTEVLCVICSK